MDPIAAIQHFEGVCTWLYLDIAGVVTTGCGLALFSVEECLHLPWDKPEGQVRADWSTVVACKASLEIMRKRGAGWYKGLTYSRITEEYALSCARAKLTEMRWHFKKFIPEYDTLPLAAREALDDLMYNLGPGWPGLEHNGHPEWPHLAAAVEKHDWKTAAAESCRPALSKERNLYVAELFLAAAKEA